MGNQNVRTPDKRRNVFFNRKEIIEVTDQFKESYDIKITRLQNEITQLKIEKNRLKCGAGFNKKNLSLFLSIFLIFSVTIAALAAQPFIHRTTLWYNKLKLMHDIKQGTYGISFKLLAELKQKDYEITGLRKDNDQLTKAINEKDGTITKHTEEKELVVQLLAELKQKDYEITGLRKDKDQLTKAINEKDGTIIKLTEDKGTAESNFDACNESREGSRKEIERLNNDIKNLNGDNSVYLRYVGIAIGSIVLGIFVQMKLRIRL